FEVADASFELLVRRESGTFEPPFTLEGYRVLVERKPEESGRRGPGNPEGVPRSDEEDVRGGAPVDRDGSDVSEATIRLVVDGERVLAVGEGVGPVHALDQALRRALSPRHPELKDVGLVDYKVRILDGRAGTRAVTRVLVTSADPQAEWTTVGVSDDIVTASWEALADGIHYGLLRAGEPARVA
ncbi:MAG: alpha-isopropylmalate synthase regulatory domain-containing protein, partial [Actinomycetota bacterium]